MSTAKHNIVFAYLFVICSFFTISASALSTDISGDAISSSFTFTGPVSVSSMSIINGFHVVGTSVTFNNAVLREVGAAVSAADAVRFSQTKILQVLMATSTTSFSTTSTSFADTNLQGTITPSQTSSKILVFALGTIRNHNVVGNNAFYSLYRGTTNLGDGNNGFGRMVVLTADGVIPCAISYLDSPNSVSSQTYKVAIRTDGSPAGVDWGLTGTQVMILMEVNGL